MLFDFSDKTQFVKVIPNRKKGEPKMILPIGMPTSFFRQPGDEAFAWGTVGLVGCTMFALVKTPTDEDRSAGVYMGHIWE